MDRVSFMSRRGNNGHTPASGFLCVALLWVIALGLGAAIPARAATPYPYSTYITGIGFNLSVTLYRPPALAIKWLTNTVALTWATQMQSFAVESATNLPGAFASENPVLVTNGAQGTITATLPVSTTRKFFRLKGMQP